MDIRQMMITQGGLKRTDSSRRAIVNARRVGDSGGKGVLREALASVGEEDIFQTVLLQPDALDLEPFSAECVNYLGKKKSSRVEEHHDLIVLLLDIVDLWEFLQQFRLEFGPIIQR